MKLLLDFLPIVLFFVSFKYANSNKDWATAFSNDHFGFMVSGGTVGANEAPVLISTIVMVVVTLAQIAYMLLRGKKINMMLWVSVVMITVLGAATVWFHNETFIKWKPTALHWVGALAFWISHTFMGKNLLQALMGKEIELPAAVWQRLNTAWVAFFALMGVLNLYVAYSFSTSTWVDFKLFGITGLLLLFILGQGVYMMKFVKPDDEPEPSKDVS